MRKQHDAQRPQSDPPADADGAAGERKVVAAEDLSIPASPASTPPPGTVHTLQPTDPRPKSRPLQIREDEIRMVRPLDVNTEQIVLTVAAPDMEWSADAGVSDHFVREDLAVHVRRADNAVIGVFPARYALAVRPTDVELAGGLEIDTAGRSTRRGAGTRHPTSKRELQARLRAQGFEVRSGSTHDRVTHPDHPGLFVPLASTPSSHRFTRDFVTQVRRVFGIDLRL